MSEEYKKTESTNESCSEYKHFLKSIELYLSLNARYYLNNSTKYAYRCELFIQNEYENITKSFKCNLNLTNKLTYLAQTEFHQIILWGCSNELDNNNNNKLTLNDRINHINEILRILSLKIQN